MFIHQIHLKPVYIQKESIGLIANLRAMHVIQWNVASEIVNLSKFKSFPKSCMTLP